MEKVKRKMKKRSVRMGDWGRYQRSVGELAAKKRDAQRRGECG